MDFLDSVYIYTFFFDTFLCIDLFGSAKPGKENLHKMFWLKIGWQHLLVGIMPGIISAVGRQHQNRSCFCKVCAAHPQGVSMHQKRGRMLRTAAKKWPT